MKYLIKELRERAGLTAKDLAKMAGLSPGYISLLERGLREPSAETLDRLAEVLGVSAVALYEAETESDRLTVEIADRARRLAKEDQVAVLRMIDGMLLPHGD